MRVIYAAEDMTVIPIGRVGENNRTQIIFDAKKLIDEYPDAEIRLYNRLPYASEAYQCELEGNYTEGETWNEILQNLHDSLPGTAGGLSGDTSQMTTIPDGKVVWTITGAETVLQGRGKCQLAAVDETNEVLALDRVWNTEIGEGMAVADDD